MAIYCRLQLRDPFFIKFLEIMDDETNLKDSTHSDSDKARFNENKSSLKNKIKYWFSVLPGRRRDYFFLGLAFLDIILLLFGDTYRHVLEKKATSVNILILLFDLLVILLWTVYFYVRLRKSGDKLEFFRTHWYEIIGLIPLGVIFRAFLLLRAAKFAIAFYRLGSSEQDVTRLITRDITFKFRDIIVDTIADAVFLQSLQRVEEVMMRLDYSKLAHNALQNQQEELQKTVHKSLKSSSMIQEISRLPLMGNVPKKVGNDLNLVINEIFESDVLGKIMKEITREILQEMAKRVRVLDVERITGKKIDLIDRQKQKPWVDL